MQNPSVSIIIPVYQVENYIERCVSSVMRQTYSHSAIECILVDDCGTDNSIILAQKRIDNYKGEIQFKIIHNEHNCGLSISRNNGMKVATGDYIFFLDSDDYISDDCIEKLMNAICNHPEVEVVKGNHIDKHINEKSSISHLGSQPIGNKKLMNLFFLGYIPCMAWNTLIPRLLIEKGHISFMQHLIYEDVLWSFYLFREVNAFMFVPDITLFYETNPHSIVNEEHKDEELHIKSTITILKNLQDHIEKRYYEGIIIYMTGMILRLIDRIKQEHNNKALLSEVLVIRNSISKRTLSDCRLILFAFSLIMYQPFIKIFKLKFFRHNYHKASCCVYELAAFFSPIHSLFKRHKTTDNNTYKG